MPETPENTQHLRLVEAILMITDQPITAENLADVLGVEAHTIAQVLQELQADYEQANAGAGRGFVLRSTGAGWRIYSHPDFTADVAAFLNHGQSARLSQAALETLAVIAYQQPVSRSRIAAIRGVSVDSVVKTLQIRGLVKEYGLEEHTSATLYQTTPVFLEKMGLKTLAELPPLSEHLPGVESLSEVLSTEETQL